MQVIEVLSVVLWAVKNAYSYHTSCRCIYVRHICTYIYIFIEIDTYPSHDNLRITITHTYSRSLTHLQDSTYGFSTQVSHKVRNTSTLFFVLRVILDNVSLIT